MRPELNRKLSLAVESVVGASLRQFAPVDASLRDTRIGKTNPNPTPAGRRRFRRVARRRRKLRNCELAPVYASWRQLTQVYATSELEKRTQRPPPPPAPLSARQLAAARMLACGKTTTEVAAELGMSRMGLFKWRKQPAFVAEICRAHDRMVTAAGAASAARAGAGVAQAVVCVDIRRAARFPSLTSIREIESMETVRFGVVGMGNMGSYHCSYLDTLRGREARRHLRQRRRPSSTPPPRNSPPRRNSSAGRRCSRRSRSTPSSSPRRTFSIRTSPSPRSTTTCTSSARSPPP